MSAERNYLIGNKIVTKTFNSAKNRFHFDERLVRHIDSTVDDNRASKHDTTLVIGFRSLSAFASRSASMTYNLVPSRQERNLFADRLLLSRLAVR